MKGIIDTHLHIWDLEKAEYPWLKGDTSILNRTWKVEEMEMERGKAGVVSAVLVQAGGNPADTDLMLQTARTKSWISGVVAWLPLMDTAETENLLEKKFLKETYFKGVRHQIHDEKDPEWLLQPGVMSSLKLLSDHSIPYDVVGILPEHLETVLKVSDQLPDLKMVLDHLNWPPIHSKEKFGRWGELIKEAAANKNIFAKISGLGTASGNFANRTADDIRPYVAYVLEQLGSKRCFCGGDWPVSMLVSNYSTTWKQTTGIVNDLLSSAEQDDVLYNNANDFYKLGLN